MTAIVIGWGTENGIPYWLLKNSYGSKWGDKGVGKIKMGKCGLGLACGHFTCSKGGKTDKV